MNNKPILYDYNNTFWVMNYAQKKNELKAWCEDNNALMHFRDPIGTYFRFDIFPKNNIDDEDYSKTKNLIMLFKLTFFVKELS